MKHHFFKIVSEFLEIEIKIIRALKNGRGKSVESCVLISEMFQDNLYLLDNIFKENSYLKLRRKIL